MENSGASAKVKKWVAEKQSLQRSS